MTVMIGHDPVMVLAVLAFLAVYIYLFTFASQSLDLPMPEDLGRTLGITSSYEFDDERLVLFIGAGLAFLLSYFLPLRHKKRGLVFSSLIIIGILYGMEGAAGLLCAHALVYLILHPVAGYRLWIAGLPGFFGFWAFYPHTSMGIELFIHTLLASSVSVLVYRYGILKLLNNPTPAKGLRVLAVQSALITVLVGAVLEGIYGEPWELTLGVLLFFWHWERLYMYHIDYQDEKIPKDISLFTYLSVFLTPGQIANWNWGVTIGQGYAYSTHNFLCEEK